MEKGKPYVGAMVWGRSGTSYYRVINVTDYHFDVVWDQGSVARYTHSGFLELGEKPYITPTEILQSLKRQLK